MKNSRIKDFFQKKRGPKRKRFKIPEESDSDSEEEVTNETTTETKAGKYGTVTTVRTVIKSKRKRERGGAGKHHQGFRSRIAPIIMKARKLKRGVWIIINDARDESDTDESDTDESENGPIGWNKPIIVRAKKGKNGAYIIIDDTDESDQGRKGGGGEAESNNDELSSELGSAPNPRGGGGKANTKWWKDENLPMLHKATLNARRPAISRQQHEKAFPLVPFTT
jgi:hypothetical protein